MAPKSVSMFSPDAHAGFRRHKLSLAALAVGIALTGCAGGQEFAFHPIDEIPQGPGLITDESGEFTLIKWDPRGRTESTAGSTVSAPAPSPDDTARSPGGISEAATPE